MAKEIASVLIIARGPLGAFVPALMAMERIRAAHPGARITLLTARPFEALARACPHIDIVDVDGEPEDFGEWADLVARLRRGRFDRVYDLECSAGTSRIFQLLRPFPPKWSGTATGCALPDRNPHRAQMHPLERLAAQLEAAGIWPDAPKAPASAPPPDASWIGRRMLEARGPRRPHVLLIPGEAGDAPEDRWPTPSFGELAHTLRTQGHDIIILGGPEESALARGIQRLAPARDLTGRTDYAQIAALCARASLAVGADAALMSLAAAAGAPCLILQDAARKSARPAPRGHVAVLCAEPLAELAVAEVLHAADWLMPPLQKTV
jgi:ADP-heptose:LPS heptosyltransferase